MTALEPTPGGAVRENNRQTEETKILKPGFQLPGFQLTAAALPLAGAAPASPALAQDGRKMFYWLSHGGTSDAFWIGNAGAPGAARAK